MPTSNIEIKAKYSDFNRAKEIVKKLGALYAGRDHQVDTYFNVPKGRLKLRESTLSGAQLIPYVRLDTSEPKRSDYLVIPVECPAKLRQLLIGILGISVVVDKTRYIYLLDNVRIHLDEVKGLGLFIEIEAIFDGSSSAARESELRVNELIVALDIKSDDLVAESYCDLLASHA